MMMKIALFKVIWNFGTFQGYMKKCGKTNAAMTLVSVVFFIFSSFGNKILRFQGQLFGFENVFDSKYYNELDLSFFDERMILSFSSNAEFKDQLRYNINYSQSVAFFAKSLVQQTDSVIHIFHACASSNGNILAEGHVVAFWRNQEIEFNEKISISMHVNRLVCLNVPCSTVFGHFVYDFLAATVLMPKNYFENAKILLAFHRDVCFDYMKHLGFNQNQLIFVDDSYIFCNEMFYMRNSVLFLGRIIYTVKMLSEKLRHNLKLENIKLTNINFLSRAKLCRLLRNVDLIIRKGQALYPKLNWVELNPFETNINSVSKQIASSIILVSSPGSGTTNLIFMKPKTGLLIPSTIVNEWTVTATCYLNIFMIVYKQVEGDYLVSEIPIDEDSFFFHFNNLYHAVKRGSYERTKGYLPFVNLTDIRERLRYSQYPNQEQMNAIYPL